MKDNLDTHPPFTRLLKLYARDLSEAAPSPSLDARIDDLVAAHRRKSGAAPSRHRRLPLYAAAAGIAALAIGVGIFIGMRLEHGRNVSAANQAGDRDTVWPPADLTMWPTDSVSFKVPAEYSPQGTLVAVDPDSKHASTRYWIDVVVSNDGTFRIEQIVPADSAQKDHAQKKRGQDGVAPQVQ